jgi:hypothetical protein
MKDEKMYREDLPVAEMEKQLSISIYPDVQESEVEAMRYRITDLYKETKDDADDIRVSYIKHEIHNAEVLKRSWLTSRVEVDHLGTGNTAEDEVPSYLNVHSEKDKHLDGSNLLAGKNGQKIAKLNELIDQKLKKKRKKVDPLYTFDKAEREKKMDLKRHAKERNDIYKEVIKHKRKMGLENNSFKKMGPNSNNQRKKPKRK